MFWLKCILLYFWVFVYFFQNVFWKNWLSILNGWSVWRLWASPDEVNSVILLNLITSVGQNWFSQITFLVDVIQKISGNTIVRTNETNHTWNVFVFKGHLTLVKSNKYQLTEIDRNFLPLKVVRSFLVNFLHKMSFF